MSLLQQCVFLGSFNHNNGSEMKEFLPFLFSIALRSPSCCFEVNATKARLTVVEGSCSASCEALSKCCRIDSGKSSRLLATFGHDAGVALDDLLESRDGSDSGCPVLGRTALGDGPAAEGAGLRRAVPRDAAELGVSPRSPASSLMSSPFFFSFRNSTKDLRADLPDVIILFRNRQKMFRWSFCSRLRWLIVNLFMASHVSI